MYICWHTSSVGVTGRLRQYRDVRQAGSMLCSRHIGSTFFKTSLYPSHSGEIRTVQRATRVAQIRRKTGNVLRLLVEIFECEEKNPRGAMSPKPVSGRTFSRVVFPPPLVSSPLFPKRLAGSSPVNRTPLKFLQRKKETHSGIRQGIFSLSQMGAQPSHTPVGSQVP